MPLTYSKGELVDRLAIEMRKMWYGANNHTAVGLLSKAIEEYQWSGFDVICVIKNALANSTIATLEWQVRDGHTLTDAETGLRARAIRKANVKRVEAKSDIDGMTIPFVPAYGDLIPIDKLTLAVQGEKAHIGNKEYIIGEKQYTHDSLLNPNDTFPK